MHAPVATLLPVRVGQISTEFYFNCPKADLVKEMYEWLEADLEKAQANRKNIPWIVVHGHRSVYCSCDGDCDIAAATIRSGSYGLENLFYKYGVDFFLNGHEHDYERMWPTYQGKAQHSNVDPAATIYVVTGAAGCKELHEPFTRPQPARSAYRSNTFGYSRMWVYNHTHIRWQQVQTDPTFFGPDKYGRVIDDVWIVQHNHGPFDHSKAPQETDMCVYGETCFSFDHWNSIFTKDMEMMAENGGAETTTVLWRGQNMVGLHFLPHFQLSACTTNRRTDCLCSAREPSRKPYQRVPLWH